jgi:CAAX protease family protein
MHPIRRYTAIAFGVTWLAVLPLVLHGLGLISPAVSPLWHGLGALGPVTAAYIMRRSVDRGVRLRDLYRRQGTRGSFPVRDGTSTGRTGTMRSPSGAGVFWTTAFLLSPLLFLAMSWVTAATVGEPVDSAAVLRAMSSPAWLANLLVASVVYGFGEEPGWRGWLLPHLQAKYGAVRSTLIVTAIWALWHAPFFAYRYDFGAGTVVGFFVGLVAGAFWLTFLFNSTGGSVMAVVVWHVLWNVANLLAASASTTVVTVLNVLAMVLGFGVAIVWGRRDLTMRRRSPAPAASTAGGRGVPAGRG